MSFSQDNPDMKSDISHHLKEESWFQLVTERASEAVANIQKTGMSDSLEASTDVNTQNGHLNVNHADSQDDVKWMETVLIF